MTDRLDLPPPTPRPCSDCPWRRAAAPGWLGPYSPEEWIEIVHGESPIACHKTIVGPDEDWRGPTIRQCRGAAVYRANVHKRPHNPSDAERVAEPDEVAVFARDAEFLEHHAATYARLYLPARRARGEIEA